MERGKEKVHNKGNETNGEIHGVRERERRWKRWDRTKKDQRTIERDGDAKNREERDRNIIA